MHEQSFRLVQTRGDDKGAQSTKPLSELNLSLIHSRVPNISESDFAHPIQYAVHSPKGQLPEL